MHRKIHVALLAGVALAMPASSVFGASPASAAKKPVKIKEISTPGVYSQWAYVEKRSYIYSRPSKFSAKVGKLAMKTPEKTDNLVYVEAQTMSGAIWYRIRVPGKHQEVGSQAQAWVPRSALGGLQAVSTYIVIDRAAHTLTLTKGGKVMKGYPIPIGVGRDDAGQRTPTPTGEYYVRLKLSGFHNPAYGPRALGTSATSKQLEKSWPGGAFIGIHGTNEPGKIPGAISHGCIRVRNDKITKLFRQVAVGTPITIQ